MITWETFERDIYLSSPYDVYHLLFSALRERASIVGYVLRVSDVDRLAYFTQDDLWAMLSAVHDVLPSFCHSGIFEQQEKILPITPAIGYPLIDSGDGLTVPLLSDAGGRRLYHTFDARLAITVYRLLRLMRYVPGILRKPGDVAGLEYSALSSFREYYMGFYAGGTSKQYTTSTGTVSNFISGYEPDHFEKCTDINDGYANISVPWIRPGGVFGEVASSLSMGGHADSIEKHHDCFYGLQVTNQSSVNLFFKYEIPEVTTSKELFRQTLRYYSDPVYQMGEEPIVIPEYISAAQMVASGNSALLIDAAEHYLMEPDNIYVYPDDNNYICLSHLYWSSFPRGGFITTDGQYRFFTVLDCNQVFSLI